MRAGGRQQAAQGLELRRADPDSSAVCDILPREGDARADAVASLQGRMGGISLKEQRVRRVEAAFASLPERYLGGERATEATYQVRLGDIGRTWEVQATPERCVVRTSPTREPDVVIGTDAGTWLALREGRLSGLDAFAQRRLSASGDLDLAVGFEGLFRLPGGRAPLLRVHEVRVKGAEISTLSAGLDGLARGPGREAPHVICLHGLGGNKTSFFETVAALAPEHRVHAIDFPGFGSSSKPPLAPFDAPYFARTVARFMDEMKIGRAHLVGNSMGGRVAIETALSAPERVSSLSLLAPALAFRRRRELVPLVKLLRPELAAIPHPLMADQVRRRFWGMFARPERLDPAVADVACEEFRRTYRSRAARVAFYASLRNIYLDPPYGERGFWTRLASLGAPSLFVWGEGDRLVPARFARHVEDALPDATQVVLADCGHVPQVELPERTNGLIVEHIQAAEAADVSDPLPARLARSA
jgi:pimeloyl-ACP methyl ester carboxylesterase